MRILYLSAMITARRVHYNKINVYRQVTYSTYLTDILSDICRINIVLDRLFTRKSDKKGIIAL